MGRDWKAKWIGPNAEDKFHPIIFKDFNINGLVTKATLYVTGVGLFEAYINGKKVGNEYLTPYISDYWTCVQYMTYDVTAYINAGVNAEANSVDIFLGNGWYKGRFGVEQNENIYGNRFATIAELIIEFDDGESISIGTNETWKYIGSDIESSGIYEGEHVNRLLWEGKNNIPKPVSIVEVYAEPVEQYSVPVVIKEHLKVRDVFYTPLGETVLDFGQNFSGIVVFKSNLPKDTTVRFEFGEVLQNGCFYNANYGSANEGFVYTSDGVEELVRPHFTYFSGRYVKVTGWVGELNPDNFLASVIYSDIRQTGFIETSDEKINRLFQNIIWSQKSNFIDIPTDSPQRDERLGWTGEICVFTPAACYNMDSKNFLMKYLRELRAEQVRIGGMIPSYIPAGREIMPSSVWGDAATFIPMSLFAFYGDIRILADNFDLMKDWVDFINYMDETRDPKHYLYDFGFQFGDKYALDGVSENSSKGATEDSFIASAYYYQSTRNVANAANALGNIDLASEYHIRAEKIKTAFLQEYFTVSGRLAIDTQTAYIVSLRFGLYIDRNKVIDAFKIRLKKDLYQIKCGIVGAPVMLNVLAENGMADSAYRILFNENYPGWLYEINMGATTIWERWNSLQPDGTANSKEKNSFNNYAYGEVAEFLYAYAAGIKPALAGFRKIRIAPLPHRWLKKMNCKYQSASGEIISNWEISEDGHLGFHIEIPDGVPAEIILPDFPEESENVKYVVGGSYNFAYLPTKDYLHKFNEDSMLSEILKDDRAMYIIEEVNPAIANVIYEGDKEVLSETMDLFREDFLMPGSPEEVDEIMTRLSVLTW